MAVVIWLLVLFNFAYVYIMVVYSMYVQVHVYMCVHDRSQCHIFSVICFSLNPVLTDRLNYCFVFLPGTDKPSSHPALYTGMGIWTHALMLVWQALYQWSRVPNPTEYSFDLFAFLTTSPLNPNCASFVNILSGYIFMHQFYNSSVLFNLFILYH